MLAAFTLATRPCDTNASFGLDRVCSLPLAGSSDQVIQSAVTAVAIFLVVLVVGRISRTIVMRALRRAETDVQVRTLVSNVMLAATIIVAVIGAFASGFGFSVVLTFGGLASLAIGLAFQDLLRNVLAGIFLLLERPFRLGDVVSVDEVTGTVQTIELRTTSLRLGDGRLAVMPNLNMFTKTVINATALERRQYLVSVWVPEGADLEALIEAARRATAQVPEVLGEPRPAIQPRSESDGRISLQAQYWLDDRSHDPDAVGVQVFRAVHAAVHRAGGGEQPGPSASPAPRPAGDPARDPPAR